MNWTQLSEMGQVSELIEKSYDRPVVIFKHSTRCGVSSMALNRLEREVPPGNIAFYFLDLVRHRIISNHIAEVFSVYHESPQVLIISRGECIFDTSHNGIRMDEIYNALRDNLERSV